MKRLNDEGQVVNPILAEFEAENDRDRANQIVLGWNDVEDAAKDLLCSVLNGLVTGNTEPVFLWKNTDSTTDLQQVVVVSNIQNNDFGVGVIHAGYTMVLPHVPLEFIEADVLKDMKKYKVGKDIITTFEKIINRWKN